MLSTFVFIIQEEQEYVELVAAEKHQQESVKSALAQNKSRSILDKILEDVRKAADRLEEEIEEHAFDNNKQVIYCIFHTKPPLSSPVFDCPSCLHRICRADERSKRGGGVESGGG